MPVYNCERYVKEAINSILSQSYTNFEFLIIDDASSDSTKTIINEFTDLRINLIEKPKNTGYTNSLNYGLSIAKGIYIARMDGDDISLQKRFSKQVAFMETHPDVAVCGTNYKIIGRDHAKLLPEMHDDIKLQLLENTCFGHPTVLIRKEILDQHNLQYNVEKEPAEDYAFWVNMLKYGKLHNIQEILLHYRVHDKQVSIKRRKIQLESKLSTRIQLLQYLGVNYNKNEIHVLKKALSDHKLSFIELLDFIRIKKYLLDSNTRQKFFKLDGFELYLNALERRGVMRYFLKRQQFTPKLYGNYLKIKKRIHFKLPIKTDIILFVKCMMFFKTIKK